MADSRSDGIKSTVIMREKPTDETANEDNRNNEKKEDKDLKSVQICSPMSTKPLLSSSKFGPSNPFTTNNVTLSTIKSGSKTLLKPSKLGPNSSIQPTKNPFTLNPSRLNPFAKTSEDSYNSDSDKLNKISATNGETPKFVPLLQSEKISSENIVKPVTALPSAQAKQSDFIFGQNLQERVISDENDPKPSTSCISSNGTSDMLFSSAIKDAVKIDSDVPNKETKSLSESAREYEESRANKRKYEEVEVITGEEGETNVLHISCKLFSYDKALGNWQERGRGNLRLNDLEVVDGTSLYTLSRLVFRTSGSLRVILNTKVWSDMTIQQASGKSVRLTAIDSSGEIKVFLVMASPEDVSKLYKHLDSRVKKEAERQRYKKVSVDKQIE